MEDDDREYCGDSLPSAPKKEKRIVEDQPEPQEEKVTPDNFKYTIIDPFMGSGTTAIACIKERRHFIGFELNAEYYAKSIERIKAEQAQLTLF